MAPEFTDAIRSITLVVAFFLMVFMERTIWMQTEALAIFGFGLALCIVPSQLLDFQVEGELSSLHMQLAQLIGAMLILLPLFWYLLNETRDGTVHISIFLSRLLTCGLILMSMVHSHWLTSRGKKHVTWSQQHVEFGMLGVTLWLLGNLFHLLRSSDYSTYPQFHIWLNSLLYLDAWLTFNLGIFSYAYPEFCINLLYNVNGIDAVHVQLFRIFSAIMVGSSVISMQGPGFLHENDKQRIFLSKIAMPILLCLTHGIQFFMYGDANIKNFCMILAFFPVLLVDLIGYFGHCSTIYKVRNVDGRKEKKQN